MCMMTLQGMVSYLFWDGSSPDGNCSWVRLHALVRLNVSHLPACASDSLQAQQAAKLAQLMVFRSQLLFQQLFFHAVKTSQHPCKRWEHASQPRQLAHLARDVFVGGAHKAKGLVQVLHRAVPCVHELVLEEVCIRQIPPPPALVQ